MEILEKPKDSIKKYEKEIDEFKANLKKIKVVINEEMKEIRAMPKI